MGPVCFDGWTPITWIGALGNRIEDDNEDRSPNKDVGLLRPLIGPGDATWSENLPSGNPQGNYV